LNLRPYQRECIDAIKSHFSIHNSTLVEAATGVGKTIIFSHLAHEWPSGRILVIAHRDELIRQAADKIEKITGIHPGIEMGDERIEENGFFDKCRVIVSSVQTMSRPDRHAKFNSEEFGLLVIDEAHHVVAGSYRAVINWFRKNPACKVLGVTATPKRADELALGQVFESVAYRYGINRAVEDGWLVPVDQQSVKVEGLDFSKVHALAGDFNEGELEKILTEETIHHKVSAPVVEIAGDRPSLVFCCTVQHAKLMSMMLERYKPSSSAWLSGGTDMRERRETIDRYKRGELQFLCNCGLFLEGFDAPTTSVVVMARPTKSIVIYAQVLGRGTRPLPGVVDGLETPAERIAAIEASDKPNMLALDFVGNSGRHKLITAADVLGGRYGIPVRDYARETVAQEERPVSVAECLDRAEAELDLLEEEKQRRRTITARAQYQTREVSPFDYRQAASATATVKRPTGEMATPKQIAYLIRLGVSREKASSFTKRQASTVIDKLLSGKAS
jgi:superfamily II DNA or RNA helicase